MPDHEEWTTSGAVPVAPRVYRIPLPLPEIGLKAVNVYAVEAGDDLLLIDAGWALLESELELERGLRQQGHTLADVTRFLVTHVHRDHYTQAVALRRRLGTRISLGIGERGTLEELRRPGARWFTTQIRLLRRYGAAEVVRRLLKDIDEHDVDTSQWEAPDDWLREGDTVDVAGRDLTVVATPGHTKGHVVFVDADHGLMFAGDHVLPHITPSIAFEHAPGLLPLGDYLRSLSLVRAMPDRTLLPAHGPVTDSVHARVDELLAHHDERLRHCLDAVAAGAGSAFEVALRLTWTRRHRAFDELDGFNQMLAVNETGAHLDLLIARGELEQESEDGVDRYRATNRSAAELEGIPNDLWLRTARPPRRR